MAVRRSATGWRPCRCATLALLSARAADLDRHPGARAVGPGRRHGRRPPDRPHRNSASPHDSRSAARSRAGHRTRTERRLGGLGIGVRGGLGCGLRQGLGAGAPGTLPGARQTGGEEVVRQHLGPSARCACRTRQHLGDRRVQTGAHPHRQPGIRRLAVDRVPELPAAGARPARGRQTAPRAGARSGRLTGAGLGPRLPPEQRERERVAQDRRPPQQRPRARRQGVDLDRHELLDGQRAGRRSGRRARPASTSSRRNSGCPPARATRARAAPGGSGRSGSTSSVIGSLASAPSGPSSTTTPPVAHRPARRRVVRTSHGRSSHRAASCSSTRALSPSMRWASSTTSTVGAGRAPPGPPPRGGRRARSGTPRPAPRPERPLSPRPRAVERTSKTRPSIQTAPTSSGAVCSTRVAACRVPPRVDPGGQPEGGGEQGRTVT